MNRLTDGMIDRIVSGMADTFRTDPEFIQGLAAEFPRILQQLQAESPRNWKARIGRRVSAFAQNTGKIRKAGRSGNSQVWRKADALDSGVVKKPGTHRRESGPPIRSSHYDNLEWMRTETFKSIKDRYDKVFGRSNCYFRPTSECIIVISLDPDCPCFIGVRSSRESHEHKLRADSDVQTMEYYTHLKEEFDGFKAGIRRQSIEESLVIRVISRALKHQLLLEETLPDLCFINHEWRFPDGRKSDILAVNVHTGRLTIIEFKDNVGKRREAHEQLRGYRDMIMDDFLRYREFFSLQLQVMGDLYGNSDVSRSNITDEAIDLIFAYPGSSGVRFEGLN